MHEPCGASKTRCVTQCVPQDPPQRRQTLMEELIDVFNRLVNIEDGLISLVQRFNCMPSDGIGADVPATVDSLVDAIRGGTDRIGKLTASLGERIG